MKGILAFCTILLLAACYDKEEVSPELIIRESTDYKYEIELPVHHEGRGNMHQLDLSEYSFEDSDWLYLDKKLGKVNYKDIVLTFERNKTNHPYCQSNLRGFIRFKEDSIMIRLIVPHYKDQDTIVDEWGNYEHNGNYKLKKR